MRRLALLVAWLALCLASPSFAQTKNVPTSGTLYKGAATPILCVNPATGAIAECATNSVTVNFPTTSGTPCATATTAGCTMPDIDALIAQLVAGSIPPGANQIGTLGATCTGTPIAINQTASADVYTSTAKMHICSIVLISATAQNLSVIEGTGSVCATSGTALIGGTTASLAVAANGGFSAISGVPWLQSKTAADHLCVTQSGTGNVSGVITLADY